MGKSSIIDHGGVTKSTRRNFLKKTRRLFHELPHIMTRPSKKKNAFSRRMTTAHIPKYSHEHADLKSFGPMSVGCLRAEIEKHGYARTRTCL